MPSDRLDRFQKLLVPLSATASNDTEDSIAAMPEHHHDRSSRSSPKCLLGLTLSARKLREDPEGGNLMGLERDFDR